MEPKLVRFINESVFSTKTDEGILQFFCCFFADLVINLDAKNLTGHLHCQRTNISYGILYHHGVDLSAGTEENVFKLT